MIPIYLPRESGYSRPGGCLSDNTDIYPGPSVYHERMRLYLESWQEEGLSTHTAAATRNAPGTYGMYPVLTGTILPELPWRAGNKRNFRCIHSARKESFN